MGVMDPAVSGDPRHHVHDRPIAVRSGTDHELHRHPRHSARMEQVTRPPIPFGGPAPKHLATRLLEGHQGIIERLFRGDFPEMLPTGRLEIDRDSAGQRRESLDLRLLRARNDLGVDVPSEAVPLPQQREDLDQLVHYPGGPRRDGRGEKESLAPAPTDRAEKHPDQLLRLEQRPRHVPVAPHRAVVAIEGAGVRHQDPKQRRRPTRSGSKMPNIDRTEGTDPPRVAEPGRCRLGRTRWALAVVGRKGHQEGDFLFQIGRTLHDNQP